MHCHCPLPPPDVHPVLFQPVGSASLPLPLLQWPRRIGIGNINEQNRSAGESYRVVCVVASAPDSTSGTAAAHGERAAEKAAYPWNRHLEGTHQSSAGVCGWWSAVGILAQDSRLIIMKAQPDPSTSKEGIDKAPQLTVDAALVGIRCALAVLLQGVGLLGGLGVVPLVGCSRAQFLDRVPGRSTARSWRV